MDELICCRPEYEIRLYTLSLVKTSISFWERQEIQTEVQNFFAKNCNYEWKSKDWHEITKKVLKLADASGIVATTLVDLKDAIINTGVKMFDWIMYVHWDYGLDLNHALPILWTPLGFVDEDKIFKSIWVNDASLYHGSPDKPIFRLACLLAQEDFIREHADEMIGELKKLPMEANSDVNVELEVVDYSDKVYGIISTYICYFVNRDWENKDYYFYASGIAESKEELEEREIFQQINNDGNALRNSMEKAMKEGLILPPDIMAKLSGWPGLIHAVKYYLKKLNSTQKKEVDKWLLGYFHLRSFVTRNNIHCRAWRFWETAAFVSEHSERDVFEYERLADLLCRHLHVCPLESVLWPVVKKLVNNLETSRHQLNNVLEMILHFIEVDQYLGIPIKRYLYQKLIKKIFAIFHRKKIQSGYDLIGIFETYCWNIRDFTWLRTAYEISELTKFEVDAEYCRRNLFCDFDTYFAPPGIPDFEIIENFFDQMFDCSNDRIRFLIEMFPQCHLLRQGKFDKWEKLYSTLNIIPAPLRNSIDPIKCLRFLASDFQIAFRPKAKYVEKCDEFIKWWHESNAEDQVNLKEKFKESSFPSECIYEYWIATASFQFLDWNKPLEGSLRLLEWLFDSEDEITKFKKEKLSVLGLLNASLTLFDALYGKNIFYKVVDEFIIFCDVPAESLGNAKDEIRRKIEDLINNFLTVHSIETFNFLMNWVSVSEETKKRIFQNLMDSSKILKLSENLLNHDLSETCMDVFYNEWILKYCNDISKLKRYLIFNYKGVRSERFMSELVSIYETLERGERLENIKSFYDLG